MRSALSGHFLANVLQEFDVAVGGFRPVLDQTSRHQLAVHTVLPEKLSLPHKMKKQWSISLT